MSTNAIVSDAASFGQTVRLARKERGLSQMELAQVCGCSQRFISQLERGKETAELGKALSVLLALGLSISVRSNDPAEEGRAAVARLVSDVEESMFKKASTRTSLSDYLGGVR